MTMNSLKKEGKVIVIDSSGAGRTLMAEILRGFGFVDVTGVPSVREALALMETEAIEWVISSLYSDQPENGVHLLQIMTHYPELKNVKISLFLEKEEFYAVPYAYELGLLNHFSKPFTKDTFKEEVGNLLARIEEEKGQLPVVAGGYLRKVLTDEKKLGDLENLEKGLIAQFPASTHLLFNLVPVYAGMGEKDRAKGILKQLTMIDQSFEGPAKEAAKMHLGGEAFDTPESGGGLNFIGVERVVIVDADDAMQKLVAETLQQLGVKEVLPFADGESALAYLENSPEPDMIIQEWRIPKVSGPLFLQRLKATSSKTCPIIIVSSLLKPADLPLVREMGVSDVIKKPLDRQELLKSFIWTIQQFRAPTEQWPMERKMRSLLAGGKTAEANEIKQRYLGIKSLSRASRNRIEAEFSFAARQYDKARDFCIESLKEAGDSIFTLNLLGKALIYLRDFNFALRCFNKAQQLSPMNVERLCTIAEVQSEMGDEKAAEETLSDAKDIDPDNSRIAEAETKVAINSGDLERAKKLMGELEMLDNVVSYMNNQAVAMARCEMFDDGIELYQKTINSIPEGKDAVKAVVTYNMALAFARQGKWDECKVKLEEVASLPAHRVTKKAVHLLARINKALETGSEINLFNADTGKVPGKDADEKDAAAAEDAARPMVSMVEIRAGEINLFKLFTSQQKDGKAVKLGDATPRFKIRNAIARSEAFGAEKTKKAS